MRGGVALEDSSGMGYQEFCDALIEVAQRRVREGTQAGEAMRLLLLHLETLWANRGAAEGVGHLSSARRRVQSAGLDACARSGCPSLPNWTQSTAVDGARHQPTNTNQ